jgi:flagellar hook capping protein FlgD
VSARSSVIAAYVLSFLLAIPTPSAQAATLTFSNGGEGLGAAASIIANTNGSVCGQVSFSPQQVAVEGESVCQYGLLTPCDGNDICASLSIDRVDSTGISVRGSFWGGYVFGGQQGWNAEGSSTTSLSFGLDEPATLRVHLTWNMAVTGDGGAAGLVVAGFFPVIQVNGQAQGDTSIDVALGAYPSYRFYLDMRGGGSSGELSQDPPSDGAAGAYSVELSLVPVLAVNDGGTAHDAISLGPAWPNPSRGSIALRLSLPTAENVAFEVVDVSGRAVNRPVESALAAGVHQLEWDGRRADGGWSPAGIYFTHVLVHGVPLTSRTLVRVP